MTRQDERLALIHRWLSGELGLPFERIEPASSDASFRRYFRVHRAEGSLIVMDAPPDKVEVQPYLDVTRLLESIGAHVPHVHEADAERGLVLLEDLGTTQYLMRLRAGDDPGPLYRDALRALADIQAKGAAAARELPPYDRHRLMEEMSLMPDWFLARHLRIEPAAEERGMLDATFELLVAESLAQPQVFVHRDYHSRNLMVVDGRNPGILDFQDAVRGPIAYDVVSLLKDCYIAWPRERVEGWLREYRAMAADRGLDVGRDEREFLRWFDLVGLQRHIKVLGIFARLWYRDGKPGYLADLPLVLRYAQDTCARYAELAGLARFLAERVAPGLPRANARELAPA